ncbi:MAG: hypothetical protein JNL97_14345 [Verrucomicrobiales bacterium]|nr:hypothetical protein [Verrucomicrobiales bacterium]
MKRAGRPKSAKASARPTPPQTPPSHTESPSRIAGGGITDAAVRKGTGRGWGEWYEFLDAEGAREMTHPQIVAVVARREASEWWQQMITVAYEQARGLREKHQKDDGFAANVGKTINAGVMRLFAAWTDDEIRSTWLDASGWNLRKVTPYKTLRITWKDGRTHVDVYFWPRTEAKTLIQIQHSKLGSPEDVHRMKAFWGVALERLREIVENTNQPQSLAA